jgi:galactose mutarotase-like enzyme
VNLSVDVLPDNGGRVASIRCRLTGTEFLLDGSDYEAQARFTADATFEESDCAGIDECLPTVAACGPETVSGSVPDHGDLWRRGWHVENKSENSVLLSTKCFSRPVSFTRRIQVQGSNVLFEYLIGNLAQIEVPFLYACHPLFAVEPGDRLILPREIDRVYLRYSRGDRMGKIGESVSWPLVARDDEQIALDYVGQESDRTAEMLYTSRLTRGVCTLYRARRGQALIMHFDIKMLPYLGLWLCNGGWPDEPAMKKQYAFAMEPTVAPHGSLAAAIASGEAPLLMPGEIFAFSIRMEVLGCDRPWSYDEVKDYVHEVPA